MCNSTAAETNSQPNNKATNNGGVKLEEKGNKSSSGGLILLSAQSYSTKPSKTAFVVTVAFMIGVLMTSEMIFRFGLYQIKDSHEVLQSRTNRLILARHLGVDTLSCIICFALGWHGRHLLRGIYDAAVNKNANAMSKETSLSRGFTYQPLSFRLSLFFYAYQIKNLYDTIVWNDGPEYVMHHVLSLAVAQGAMYPSYASMYAMFYFGISELSTAVLCVLANFDEPPQGVEGLGAAMPLLKIIVGIAFCVLFIICRCILWPVISYYFVRDCQYCLQLASPDMLKGRKWVIYMNMVCLSLLTLLQLIWLFVLFFIAHKEITAFLETTN